METLAVKIWRGVGRAAGHEANRRADKGYFQDFTIPRRDNQTVLDVVSEIQRGHDHSLSYRFACRVGVCGSCAMTVNGKPRWTCRTHIRALNSRSITIEPLRNMALIKDLVTDMTAFFDKWGQAGNAFASERDRTQPPAPVNPLSEKRIAADAAIECINCGVCHAACDVVRWNDEYLGPAALNRAWSLVNDERHTQKQETLTAALGAGGCSNCHTQGNCMAACPIGLNPTRSIAGLKKINLSLSGKS